MPRVAKTDKPEPRLSVIDRRVAHPFGTPSRQIPLKPELMKSWVVRIFTKSPEHPNRHYAAVHEYGWTLVTVEDLAVSPEEIGYVKGADGAVVAGEKGEHKMFRMLKRDFDRVQKAKSDANTRALRGGKLKDEVAQATARAHGDEAGDFTAKHFTAEEEVGPVGA